MVIEVRRVVTVRMGIDWSTRVLELSRVCRSTRNVLYLDVDVVTCAYTYVHSRLAHLFTMLYLSVQKVMSSRTREERI